MITYNKTYPIKSVQGSVVLFLYHQFLPQATFGLQVLSLPASVCVCVRPSVTELVRTGDRP